MGGCDLAGMSTPIGNLRPCDEDGLGAVKSAMVYVPPLLVLRADTAIRSTVLPVACHILTYY